ncbi:undecaprenyldiphospho-muramoylpentapeptide beta-N-acetylglucosaminyltransferase [Hyphobacterium marinum]|uniref:UDP-N-acetylglucosamine--N-acetylmuramyl-(pentapeptide) pyrophosphoryl-undecaprenol N-acetylglucosamine transferase n=1 Tax=Hyphobacterium marinum TaxID=3116574 RepID=A0ABU7LWX6_9PROT|nr:undecaprenyldiphospho-muramoylpentapeptide beta-N-acetylglucosaminyltransferase [Hyphobacterium sp. Y6023]MEE2566053.1 undecaprenyldiphospho-muramoylpentapeptide beta-N-acetylglucosaminyltransferase [Hyphobacterium sp. Y6023]
MSRRILLAAGGTGGHVFPARAAADALITQGWSVRLITDVRGAKHTADFPAETVDIVDAASPSTRNPIKLAKAAIALTRGVGQARRIVREWKPDVVAGFGGYPAFPALKAAQIARIPYAIHEQNAVLGRVNRLFAAKAAFVASGFERLDRAPKGTKRLITGNPVRSPILAARNAGYPALTTDGPVRLLVLGGSLGARLLSETVPQAVAMLPEMLRNRLEVAQQTREESLAMAQEIYRDTGVNADCRPFFDDVGERLAASHFVIARAGASSVSEVACVGRPAIFVPLAIAADDHQTANAESLVEAGAADALSEREFTPEALAALLEVRLMNDSDLAHRAETARAIGRPDAAGLFADAINALMPGPKEGSPT